MPILLGASIDLPCRFLQYFPQTAQGNTRIIRDLFAQAYEILAALGDGVYDLLIDMRCAEGRVWS